MSGRTIPVRIGDIEVLVETTPAAGTQPTSRTSDATVVRLTYDAKPA